MRAGIDGRAEGAPLPEGFGALLPELITEIPGPASRAWLERLGRVESRNVTFGSGGVGNGAPEKPDWPIVWSAARGANVLDADGNRYLDLTAAFGVALAGHRPDSVARAIQAQSELLLHGMGDVHPPHMKVELLEALASLLPWPEVRTTLATSGSEAVEIALKTAQLRTGRPGIIAFDGGYHGLTLGALAATHRSDFRAPFAERSWGGVGWAPWPGSAADPEGEQALAQVAAWLQDGVPIGVGGSDRAPVGSVIIEPVQARGGVRMLPDGFGARLSALVEESRAVLIADEIFTGLGRCGAVLASDRVGLRPEVVALGKVLGGGMPLSACVGTAEVMAAWPASTGEALHTSTFLGHPLACAAGVAMLRDEVAKGLPARADAAGAKLRTAFDEVLAGRPGTTSIRGLGLLLGFECLDADGCPEAEAAVEIAIRLLARGVLVLPAGEIGSVVELTPPVLLTDPQVAMAAQALAEVLNEVGRERASQ